MQDKFPISPLNLNDCSLKASVTRDVKCLKLHLQMCCIWNTCTKCMYHWIIYLFAGPFQCEPCQRVFKTRSRLLKHEQSFAHCKKSGQKFTLERNFLCTECGKSFYSWVIKITYYMYYGRFSIVIFSPAMKVMIN